MASRRMGAWPIVGVALALLLAAWSAASGRGDAGAAPSDEMPSAVSTATLGYQSFVAQSVSRLGGDFIPVQPRVLALAGDLIFMADRAGAIFRYRLISGPELVLEKSWVMPEIKNGNPAALAWDTSPGSPRPEGTLLIGETHYGRVTRTTADGEILSSFGRVGSEPGLFQRIQGIAVARGGEIYVSETFDHTERIQIFDPDGVWLGVIGGEGSKPGRFNRPRGIAISDRDELYVADSANHRVQVFGLGGEFLRVIAEPDLRYPFDLGFDAAGRLYVLEMTGGRVLVFLDDQCVLRVGGAGDGVGKLAQPWGLAVRPDGSLVIADTRNDRMVLASIAGLP